MSIKLGPRGEKRVSIQSVSKDRLQQMLSSKVTAKKVKLKIKNYLDNVS